MKIKDILSEKFSKEELELVRSSFDIVGDIAVVEIPEELEEKEKTIAEAIKELHKNVNVVAKKTGPTSGEKRIRPVKVISGEKRTETTHIENGCRFKVDLNNVFFSPRLGTEHLRVTDQVEKTELVFDPFAGVGPFAIPIAKKGAKVIAVDLNKEAIKFLKENAKINKVADNIEIFQGDAREVLKKEKYKEKADRVIMNLPMHSEDFLDLAFFLAKKSSIVHFYCFLNEEELYQRGIDTIKSSAKKSGKKVKILKKRKCGQLAPRVWRVVIDFKVY